MTSDTLEFADRLIEAVAARTRTSENNESNDQEKRTFNPLAVGRFLCWGLAIALAGVGLTFSAFHWVGHQPMPPGVPTWFAAALILAVLCEGKIQAAQHYRQLRHDIRSHAPADAVELARIATLVRRAANAVARQGERLDQIGTGLNVEREKTDLVMKALVKFIDERAPATPAGDRLDAELRGFLAARLHSDEPPPPDAGS